MDTNNKVRKIVSLIHAGDFVTAIKEIQQKPLIIYAKCISSVTCSGYWAMPMWKYFGYLLEHNLIKNTTEQDKKNFARFISDIVYSEVKKVDEIKNTPEQHAKEARLNVFMNYALVADWPDIIQEVITAGLPISEKQYFDDRHKSQEVQAIWDAWCQ